jgi:hypothetical protein
MNSAVCEKKNDTNLEGSDAQNRRSTELAEIWLGT